MYLTFDDIGISGLAAAVPQRVVDNLEPPENFTVEEAEQFVKLTGIRYRRHAKPDTCASDLCWAAAERLIRELDVDRGSVDVLLFVSHTPDHRKPATSLLLQHRLGLENAAALDVNLGCSGYVYGLFTAYSMLSNPGVGRVLLLNGETLSRSISQKDKATGLIFGDAGAATLVERRKGFGRSSFSLRSDGARAGLIIAPAGGYRRPSSPETLLQRRFEDGSIRSEEQTVMDGAGVFNFILTDVHQDLAGIMRQTGETPESIDYFVLHQANRFAMEHIRRKLRIPPDKVPYSLDEFGNTSGASIPITLVTRLQQTLRERTSRVLLSGYGVGLSWGSVVLELGPAHVCDLMEFDTAA